MSKPYDHESLWIKAKLFINRAMDDDGYRSFDEQALWAALALELLAKAALARYSPALIAEPNEEGTNLLIASGLVQGDARFTSVRAKTLISRCQKAFKPFNSAEALLIIEGRNEYLHSSGAGFVTIPPHAWWPRYWAQASILVTALDKKLEELVGLDRESVVNKHLAQNMKNVEHRVETLIERAKQRLAQFLDGSLPARVAAEWKPGTDLTEGFSYWAETLCVACGYQGVLEGEEVTDKEINWVQVGSEEDYDYDPVVTLTVGADHFSCSNCGLILDRYEYIKQAGLPVDFTTAGNPEDAYDEPEYGND